MHDLFVGRKYDELLQCCSDILEKDPQNIEALKYKAYSYFFLHRYEEALWYYNEAIKLEPDNPSNYSAKSRVLEMLERHQEAKECYAKALKLKDQSTLGHNKDEWGIQQNPLKKIRFIEAYTVTGNLGKTDTHGFLRSHLKASD